jgi:hypothetical protein
VSYDAARRIAALAPTWGLQAAQAMWVETLRTLAKTANQALAATPVPRPEGIALAEFRKIQLAKKG